MKYVKRPAFVTSIRFSGYNYLDKRLVQRVFLGQCVATMRKEIFFELEET